MDRASTYIWVPHVAATTQKTAGHGTRNTKINESQSSCSWSMYNTQHPEWIKKEIISFTVIAPAEFPPLVVKNVVLTLFQGRFS